MLRRLLPTLGLVAVLLAACQPEPVSIPIPGPAALTPAATETPTAPAHADAIRFALVGEAHLTNVWAYFDAAGADYNNRAIQANLWPSLHRLSPLAETVEPYLAASLPAIVPETETFFLDVTLRPNLLWSDGTPLTAEDAAFTINTALNFRLGLDWAGYYNPELIQRAEAPGPLTVRVHFSRQPSALDLHYGVLQGPVVNAAYWGPKIAEAETLLSTNADLDQTIVVLRGQSEQLQRELDDLLYQLNMLDTASTAYQDTQTLIYGKQEEINFLGKQIEDRLDEKDTAFEVARQALYALDAENEPTFGPFVPRRHNADEFENAANPLYPFTTPNFDRAVYRLYPDEESAVRALMAGEANVVLDRDGVARLAEGSTPAPGVQPRQSVYARSNLRVLAFNLERPALQDVYLRRAIACLGDGQLLAGAVTYPEGLILPGMQPVPQRKFPCAGLSLAERLDESVRLLETAGYAWDAKPVWDGAARAGSGLKRRGVNLPAMTLLVSQEESLRVSAADAAAGLLRTLGLDVQVEQVENAELVLRVFDTGQYDLAVLGWRVARVPVYLCDWLGAGNPYGYQRAELLMHCNALRTAADLESAHRELLAVHDLVAEDVPLVPLYAETGVDLYAGVSYPFHAALDGIAGWYGAPWLALPAP